MSVLAQTDGSTPGALARSFAHAHARDIEVRELLHAVTALRSDGILTEAEYEAKRQQLAAQR
jgi:hypothetical protein